MNELPDSTRFTICVYYHNAYNPSHPGFWLWVGRDRETREPDEKSLWAKDEADDIVTQLDESGSTYEVREVNCGSQQA